MADINPDTIEDMDERRRVMAKQNSQADKRKESRPKQARRVKRGSVEVHGQDTDSAVNNKGTS